MKAAVLNDKQILVVEDEPFIAMLIQDLLEEMGCRPIGPARSVDEGKQLIAKHSCDAAIVDLNLGKERSYDLIDILVARKVPVIVATGYGNADPRVPAQCPVVQKPFRVEILQKTLEGLLQTS